MNRETARKLTQELRDYVATLTPAEALTIAGGMGQGLGKLARVPGNDEASLRSNALLYSAVIELCVTQAMEHLNIARDERIIPPFGDLLRRQATEAGMRVATVEDLGL